MTAESDFGQLIRLLTNHKWLFPVSRFKLTATFILLTKILTHEGNFELATSRALIFVTAETVATRRSNMKQIVRHAARRQTQPTRRAQSTRTTYRARFWQIFLVRSPSMFIRSMCQLPRLQRVLHNLPR